MSDTTIQESEPKKKFTLSRIFKIVLKGLGILLLIIALAFISFAWYINSHKEEVLQEVTQTLNENLKGTLTIGDMEPTFLSGFPSVSLRLEDVIIRDSLYAVHKKTLLKAGELDLSINALAFIRGTIRIRKIAINNATINLYTDANGYSNTAVFKKNNKAKNADEESGGYPEIKKFILSDVAFVIDNQRMGKLYNFQVNDLKGNMTYSLSGWDAIVNLDVLVKSMAFSTRKGSFIKNRVVDGSLEVNFDEDAELITIAPGGLDIGGEDFIIGAKFKTGGPTSDFAINIENKEILWKNASALLSPNISSRLDMFNLTEPIAVKCDIVGDFNIKGDPLIRVNAFIKDNTLTTPGGTIANCNFIGVFTNNHVKSNGFNDANSAVKLFNFNGSYNEIPFVMDKMFILDLEKPIATGSFKSKFDITKLGNILDKELLTFTKGNADVNLNFTADIVNYKLTKPMVTGTVVVNNTNIKYVPRKLAFDDVNLGLRFTKEDMYISKINLKSGRSVVSMDGEVKNFLNLYYTAPEKIILNWNVYSPQLHLGEFLGFLESRTKSKPVKDKKGSFSQDLNMLFEKSNVDIKLKVDKLYYNKFLATNAVANVLLADNKVIVKNSGFRHAGGTLAVSGNLVQGNTVNKYSVNATVKNVDIKKFFYSFNSFGIESIKPENIRGSLSSKVNLTGSITGKGAMLPKSMYGTVAFDIKRGALVNFDPIRKVGKYAFPFRDMNNITFTNLEGDFDVKGEKVIIKPMQVNSSVLNMDIAGIYSFGKGTDINVAVPLRDPRKDKNITDKKELAERRNRGIVVRLNAADDDDGKVGIKLGSSKNIK